MYPFHVGNPTSINKCIIVIIFIISTTPRFICHSKSRKEFRFFLGVRCVAFSETSFHVSMLRFMTRLWTLPLGNVVEWKVRENTSEK